MPRDSVRPFQYWLVTFDGTLLRKHRRDRELSQQRLSNRSRISLGTIQRIEKQPAATCHASTLYRIAAALSPDDPDALISELTAGSGSSPRPQVPRRPLPPPRPEQRWRQGKPFPVNREENGRYDAATARELLTMTGDFPRTKNGMLILLTEYRHALYDIAVRSAGNRTDRMSDDMAIDRASIRHAYRQVADAIAARIAAGRYPCKLPREPDLAEEFGVFLPDRAPRDGHPPRTRPDRYNPRSRDVRCVRVSRKLKLAPTRRSSTPHRRGVVTFYVRGILHTAEMQGAQTDIKALLCEQ